jgi:hypothetical protein
MRLFAESNTYKAVQLVEDSNIRDERCNLGVMNEAAADCARDCRLEERHVVNQAYVPGIIDDHAASDSGDGFEEKVRLCCQTSAVAPGGTEWSLHQFRLYPPVQTSEGLHSRPP